MSAVLFVGPWYKIDERTEKGWKFIHTHTHLAAIHITFSSSITNSEVLLTRNVNKLPDMAKSFLKTSCRSTLTAEIDPKAVLHAAKLN